MQCIFFVPVLVGPITLALAVSDNSSTGHIKMF